MTNQDRATAGAWTSREAYLLALVCLVVGILLGYLFHGSTPAPVAPPTAAGGTMPSGGGPQGMGMPPGGFPVPAGSPPPTAASLEGVAAPLLAAIKADPNNVENLVQLGNLYYDHRVYPEAIEYYTKALVQRPNDVNVRTDLGTAFWYSSLPDKAVKEYEKSLAVDPGHANTLFNMGVVKSEGLKDYAGAIAAWEKLLKSNPQYPQRQRVEELIAQARAKLK